MDLEAFTNANFQNHIFKSRISQVLTREPCILGIDEAGRGPVLGPMVYGICFCPKSFESRLKDIKVADSKTLTEEQREGLFELIDKNCENIGWMVQILSPNVISNSMLRRIKYNLNAMSHDSAICLVENALADGVNVTEVFVDTVGPPEKYQAKLSAKFPDIKVTVSKKADSLFPVVSAASIIAKVARDRAIKQWIFAERLRHSDISVGSGYPNDPVTKTFLKENCDDVFGFPQLVRFSWSTVETIVNDKCVEIEWEDVDENGEVASKSSNIFSYFSHPSNNSKKHNYFSERNLKNVLTLT